MLVRKFIFFNLFFFLLSAQIYSQESFDKLYLTSAQKKTYVIKGNSYQLLKGIVASSLNHIDRKKISETLNKRAAINLDQSFVFELKGPFVIYLDHQYVF